VAARGGALTVATYAFIHGAGDGGWYWHRVAGELSERGHDAVAPDLPSDDESAGWREYADTVADAIGDRSDVIVVGQSLGGFTAPLVCERRPVDLVVLVAGMVPAPGETGGEWWSNTGYERAAREAGAPDDEIELFLHDVPPELATEALARARDQAGRPMTEPLPLDAWPEVPTRYLLCRQDRFFPAEWLRGVVRERLGFEPDEIDAAHTPALSRPAELAERLEAYRDVL
jgi:pimeloyl-ACP methyl ester carboxylesterase